MLHSPYRPVRRASLRRRARHWLKTHGVDAPLHEKVLVTALAYSLPVLTALQLALVPGGNKVLHLPTPLNVAWTCWGVVAVLLTLKWMWQDRGHVPAWYVIWQREA